MANLVKTAFLDELIKKYGKVKQLAGSLSLFEIGDGSARIYIRYSKIHGRNQSFYGLRKEDLKQLEGFNSVICFLWANQTEPVFIPFADFEDVFSSLTPASDGQFKCQIYHGDGIELYIANAGRFSIEGYFGWEKIDDLIEKSKIAFVPDFSHSQIQTFIGSIGAIKGYDVWIPPNDRNRLDWNLADRFVCKNELPSRYAKIDAIVSEIDVVWLQRGASEMRAMFEVEHSTQIYSGLLRFNDLYLVEPNLKPKFSIVSNEIRRSLFFKQINRPTFRLSGLSDICNFLEYRDVYSWFNRTRGINK
jgi:hypothetical protein